MLESTKRVMELDKAVEGKVKPSVYPFKQAPNGGASNTAACKSNYHTAILFMITGSSCHLFLGSGLEGVKRRLIDLIPPGRRRPSLSRRYTHLVLRAWIHIPLTKVEDPSMPPVPKELRPTRALASLIVFHVSPATWKWKCQYGSPTTSKKPRDCDKRPLRVKAYKTFKIAKN